MLQTPSDRGKNSGECPFPIREKREQKLPTFHPHISFLSTPPYPIQKGLLFLTKRSVPYSFPCPGIGPRRSLPAPPESGSEHRLEPSLCATDLSLKQLPFHSIHESHVHTWKTLRQTSSSLRGKPFGHTAAQTFGRPPKMRPHVHPKTYPPSLPFIISIAGGSVRLLRSCDIDNSSSVSLPFAVERSPLRM